MQKALALCRDYDPNMSDLALRVYDFTQNAVEVWQSSNMCDKQQILRAISLNRTLGPTSLALEKRKPFSFLTERLPVRTSRGDCTQFEPNRVSEAITPVWIAAFSDSAEPHLSSVARIWQESA